MNPLPWLRKNWRRSTFIAGLIVGALCPFIDPRYGTPCHVVAQLAGAAGSGP